MGDVAEPSSSLRGDHPVAASAQGLADRNALAIVALERSRMPMVVTDPRQPDNPIVLAHKAFLKLTGYEAEEVIGRNCRFLQGPGTSPDAVEVIRSALSEERDVEVEVLNYRKDGSAFWNQLALSPVHDEDGKLLYMLGSQIDVTELREVQRLEASEHRLLREVDHRARNVLAVVNGIVRLSRADDPSRYASAIQDRVQVLAQAHSLLANRGWQEVPLQDVLRQTIDPAEQRLEVDGDEIIVPALIVQPIALVVHELLDNARTHGALSVPAGEVKVFCQRASEPCGFQLHWREVGGPAPPENPRHGFGTAMLSGMVERQLRGEVERAWVDGGLSVTITVPGTLEPAIA